MNYIFKITFDSFLVNQYEGFENEYEVVAVNFDNALTKIVNVSKDFPAFNTLLENVIAVERIPTHLL